MGPVTIVIGGTKALRERIIVLIYDDILSL